MSGIRRKIKGSLPAFFQATGLKPFASDAAYVTAKGAPAAEGDSYWNSTNEELRGFIGAQWRSVLTQNDDGTWTIDNTTDATSSADGALNILGGLGIAKKLFVGTDADIGNNLDVGNDLDVTGSAAVGVNLTVTGDLTVNGTTTTLNTATLDVTDVNITVNKGGNQAAADDAAGITVEMSDATDGSILYDKDATSRWAIGDVASEKEIATISDTQTLTNKTIDTDGPNTISNIRNTNIAGNAAIARSKVATASVNHVVINDGLGALSTEATLAKTRGGTGADNSSVTFPASGVIVTEAGVQTLTNKTIAAGSNTLSGLTHGSEVDNPTTGVHGVTGTVVGTSDAQILTNKTIDADSNTLSNIENADIKTLAAIDATKLADGSVTNTELQFINTLSSNAQTQFTGKASTTLNNLGTTSINADLIPAGDGTLDIGAFGGGNHWDNIFARGISLDNSSGIQKLSVTAKGSTLPDGSSPSGLVEGTNANTEVLGIINSGVGATGGVLVGTINVSSTSDSGFVKIRPGAIVSGTRGDIVLEDGSEGTAGQIWTSKDTSGSGNWEPAPSLSSPSGLINAGISAVAAAGALTVALKQSDGSTDPSTSESKVVVAFRNTTITNGGYTDQEYTAAESVVIPSGATLGFLDGQNALVYVYTIFDGTNLELAVSSRYKDEGATHSTVAIGAASDAGDLYSTTARTGAAVRLIGKTQVDAITTAGTWTTPDISAVNNFGIEMVPKEFFSAISSVKTSSNSGSWMQFTGNSIELPPGRWQLTGTVEFLESGGSPDYSDLKIGWRSANGADTSGDPAAITLDAGGKDTTMEHVGAFTRQRQAFNASAALLDIDVGDEVFLDAFSTQAVNSRTRVTVNIYIERVGG